MTINTHERQAHLHGTEYGTDVRKCTAIARHCMLPSPASQVKKRRVFVATSCSAASKGSNVLHVRPHRARRDQSESSRTEHNCPFTFWNGRVRSRQTLHRANPERRTCPWTMKAPVQVVKPSGWGGSHCATITSCMLHGYRKPTCPEGLHALYERNHQHDNTEYLGNVKSSFKTFR